MKSAVQIIQAALQEKRTALFEHEAKELARSAGIVVPRFEITSPGDEAALFAAADRLGFPLAVKAEAPGVLHKTEAGALVLDVMNRAQLSLAVKKIRASLEKRAAGSMIRHFLVERMMPAGLELLIGGLRDEQFGTSVAFGLGGVWTEALKDVAFGICPMTREEIGQMIGKTKAAVFFGQFRGGPPLDREPVISIVNAVSQLLLAHPQIREIDLNPVRIYERGAAALDVRILLSA